MSLAMSLRHLREVPQPGRCLVSRVGSWVEAIALLLGPHTSATMATSRPFFRKLCSHFFTSALALITALTAVTALASLFVIFAGAQTASAGTVGECMVDRFDALVGSGAGGTPLNCTCDAVLLATYSDFHSDAPSCLGGAAILAALLLMQARCLHHH